MQIRRRINEDMWTITIVSEREMKKLSGDKATAGLCIPYERNIYVREDSVEYSVVSHELFHAYFSYLCLSDTNDIKLDDFEEIGASFFAAKGELMVKKAKQFTRELQHLMEGEEE